MLAVLAAEGLARLADAMQDARDAAGADPGAGFSATGLAHVKPALAASSQFRLMFHSDRADQADSAVSAAGEDASGMLLGVLDKGGIAGPGAIADAWSAPRRRGSTADRGALHSTRASASLRRGASGWAPRSRCSSAG